MRRLIYYTTPIVIFGLIQMAPAAFTQNAVIKKDSKPAVLSIAYFSESANNSINSLYSLLKKDNYRNKIATLNNPANSELGFNLKNEIMIALKPMLDKAKKTDHKKFGEVMDNFLSSPEENALSSVTKYLPALGIFSTVLSLVGNLVVSEKNITRDDLNQFTGKVSQYFSQYQRLNEINIGFATQVQKLLDKTEETKQDLKEFLMDCILTLNDDISPQTLKSLPIETLILKYYDPQKLNHYLDTARVKGKTNLFPPDAPTSIKFLTSAIKKLHKEFESVYSENYKQFKELMTTLKTTLPNLDQNQLNKTSQELDKLYTESRQADLTDLNFNQVDERMNTACKLINANR